MFKTTLFFLLIISVQCFSVDSISGISTRVPQEQVDKVLLMLQKPGTIDSLINENNTLSKNIFKTDRDGINETEKRLIKEIAAKWNADSTRRGIHYSVSNLMYSTCTFLRGNYYNSLELMFVINVEVNSETYGFKFDSYSNIWTLTDVIDKTKYDKISRHLVRPNIYSLSHHYYKLKTPALLDLDKYKVKFDITGFMHKQSFTQRPEQQHNLHSSLSFKEDWFIRTSCIELLDTTEDIKSSANYHHQSFLKHLPSTLYRDTSLIIDSDAIVSSYIGIDSTMGKDRLLAYHNFMIIKGFLIFKCSIAKQFYKKEDYLEFKRICNSLSIEKKLCILEET